MNLSILIPIGTFHPNSIIIFINNTISLHDFEIKMIMHRASVSGVTETHRFKGNRRVQAGRHFSGMLVPNDRLGEVWAQLDEAREGVIGTLTYAQLAESSRPPETRQC